MHHGQSAVATCCISLAITLPDSSSKITSIGRSICMCRMHIRCSIHWQPQYSCTLNQGVTSFVSSYHQIILISILLCVLFAAAFSGRIPDYLPLTKCGHPGPHEEVTKRCLFWAACEHGFEFEMRCVILGVLQSRCTTCVADVTELSIGCILCVCILD